MYLSLVFVRSIYNWELCRNRKRMWVAVAISLYKNVWIMETRLILRYVLFALLILILGLTKETMLLQIAQGETTVVYLGSFPIWVTFVSILIWIVTKNNEWEYLEQDLRIQSQSGLYGWKQILSYDFINLHNDEIEFFKLRFFLVV